MTPKIKELDPSTTDFSKYPKNFKDSELDNFNEIYNELLTVLIGNPDHGDIPESVEWLEKLLNYTMINRNKIRGFTTVYAFRQFCKNATKEQIKESYVLGWLLEMLLSSSKLSFDIIDGVEYTRGQLSWHKKEDLGIIGFNDTLISACTVTEILKKYFQNKPYYLSLIKAFHEGSTSQSIGRSIKKKLTINAESLKEPDYFMKKKYNLFVQHDKSIVSFYFPVLLAMILAQVDEEKIEIAKNILCKIGYLYQLNLEYINCFQPMNDKKDEITKEWRKPSDISMGCPTWFIFRALKLASAEQMKVIKEIYGNENIRGDEKIQKIYRDLYLLEDFDIMTDNLRNEILDDIGNLDADMPKRLFMDILIHVSGSISED